MLNTAIIFEELKDTMSEVAARKIANILGRVYHELLNTVTKTEFTQLTNTVDKLGNQVCELTTQVTELAAAQKRTEVKVEELAAAQKRTEVKVEELAEAQKRTEIRVEELAEAQKRTEIRVEELATDVKELAETQKQGFQSLKDQIAALGGRWGIYNEGTFRATIQGVFKKMQGIEVKEGYYGNRQVDIIIRNGEHILLEITSRMHPKDIEKLYSSADDYKQQVGVEPILMVATSYISPRLMQKIMGLERKIDIFSYEGENDV
ncbi:MAG: DUF3782 domain-containing protein [Desulfobacterales bacterium]|nr:DUF3782 domain-containing protein [Desulfobacterales bacterium]